MIIDKCKFQIALAEAGIRAKDLTSISKSTYLRVISGKSVRPSTVGKLAKELGVHVTDLVGV